MGGVKELELKLKLKLKLELELKLKLKLKLELELKLKLKLKLRHELKIYFILLIRISDVDQKFLNTKYLKKLILMTENQKNVYLMS